MAMDGILRVTPERLISTADEFNTTGGQIRNVTQQMIEIINGLKSVWEGEAATAYNTKFHELDDDIEKMHRMIQEHVTDLKEMAEQYKQAESANMDISQGLEGNVIE